MTRTKEHKALYTILGIGAFGTLLGHGMFAIDGKESFIGLLKGSLDNVFGVTVSTGTAESWVQAIGWLDLALAAVIGLFVIGAIRERGSLYTAAYSRLAIGVFTWGALWGFATAFSRVTAADAFYPAVWDWVERAPNFVLPAGLLYVIVRHRTVDVPTHAPIEGEYTKA